MAVKIIAEIGWNFMGDMTLAKQMITAAKNCGADIAKFQYWNPQRLKPGAWDHDGRREIYEKAQLTKEKINKLVQMCENKNIGFLIAAFNVHDAKMLKTLGLKNIKIPSHEVANVELHEYAVKNFQEIYVSLGAGTEEEVTKTIEIYKQNAGPDTYWVGMHCVSSYPTPASKCNLPRLKYLREKVETLGFSDHTRDVITPAVSVALGATVIEKHFTINKGLPGRDNQNAQEPKEFKQMVENIRIAEAAMIHHGDGAVDIEYDTMHNYRGRWGANS